MDMVLSPVDQPSLAQIVYERMRNAIFSGQFVPGQRLDTRALARSLQVSTQPVKDALARLNLEGMVTIRARSGTFVASLAPDEAAEIMEVRSMMEQYAISYRPTLTPEWDERLSECARTMTEAIQQEPYDWVKYNEYDMAFHEGLMELAGNTHLLRIYRSLHSHWVTGRYYYGRIEKARASHPDHEAILANLRAQNYEGARAVVVRHIQEGIDLLRRLSAGSSPSTQA